MENKKFQQCKRKIILISLWIKMCYLNILVLVNPKYIIKNKSKLKSFHILSLFFEKNWHEDYKMDFYFSLRKLFLVGDNSLIDEFFSPISKVKKEIYLKKFAKENTINSLSYNYLKNQFPLNYKSLIDIKHIKITPENELILKDFHGAMFEEKLQFALGDCKDKKALNYYQTKMDLKVSMISQLLIDGKSHLLNYYTYTAEDILKELMLITYRPHRKGRKWFFNILKNTSENLIENYFYNATNVNDGYNNLVIFFEKEPKMLFEIKKQFHSIFNEELIDFYALYHFKLKSLIQWLNLTQKKVSVFLNQASIKPNIQLNSDYKKLMWMMDDLEVKEKKILLTHYLQEAENNVNLYYRLNNKQLKNLLNLSMQYNRLSDLKSVLQQMLNQSSPIIKNQYNIRKLFKKLTPQMLLAHEKISDDNIITKQFFKNYAWYSGNLKLIKENVKMNGVSSHALQNLIENQQEKYVYRKIFKFYPQLLTKEALCKNNNQLIDLIFLTRNNNFLSIVLENIDINQFDSEDLNHLIKNCLLNEEFNLREKIILINNIKVDVNWYDKLHLISENASFYPYYLEKAIKTENKLLNNKVKVISVENEEKIIKKRQKI
jgi:hypothetical protein